MTSKKLSTLLLTLVLLFSLAMAGCGGQAEAPVVVGEEPAEETEPTDAPVVEEEPTEAPEPTAVPEPTLDVDALLDTYLTETVPSLKAFGTISPADLSTALLEEELFILDVREFDEGNDQGYIEGSVAIPLRELAQHFNEIPTDMPIVVYCGSGHRSALAMVGLQLAGYEDVRSMSGGFKSWTAAELPVVTEVVEASDYGDPGFDPQVVELIDGWLTNLPQGWGVIQAADLSVELVESELFLLDVRTDDEYANGYIEGSFHAPLDQMLADTSSYSEPMVVYCGSGHRSAMALAIAQLAGFEDVRSLGGGLKSWTAAELPLAGVLNVEATVAEYTEVTVPALARYGTISAEELYTQVVEGSDLPFILDVRQPDELDEAGYIEGAVNVPLRELAQHLDLLPTDQRIVVYCGSGHRSALGMTALQLLGYEAQSMTGGINAWNTAGYPLVDAPQAEPEVFGAPSIDPLLVEAIDETLMGLPEGWGTVKVDALSVELLEAEPPILLDGRRADEYVNGWIEGATNVPLEQLVALKDQWPAKDANIVVYCGSGHRSAMQFFLMRFMGFTSVRSMTGGVNAWTTAGFPLVTE